MAKWPEPPSGVAPKTLAHAVWSHPHRLALPPPGAAPLGTPVSTFLCWSRGVPQTCFQADPTPPARIPSAWTHEVFRKQDRTWGSTRGRWAHGSALWLTVPGSHIRTTPWWCRRGYLAQLSPQLPGMVQPVSKSLLSDHCVQGGQGALSLMGGGVVLITQQ